MSWLTISCLVVALAGAGCGQSLDATTGSGHAGEVSRVKIRSGSEEQRSLLREIVAGMGESRIGEIEITKPDVRWRPLQPRDVALVVRTTGKKRAVRASWEAMLVATAFADRSEELGLPRVLAVETNGGGTRVAGPDADGGAKAHEPVTGGSCDEVSRASVSALVRDAGGDLVDFALLHPDGFAPVIVVRLPDPPHFLKDRAAALLGAFDRWFAGCRGMYVEAVDGAGQSFWAIGEGRSRTLHWATSETRPDLKGCYPIPRFPPGPEFVPPPCPA
jgi:hypothetical protein